MSYSIIAGQTPVLTDQNDSGQDYAMGTRFTTSSGGTVSGGRWYFPSILPTAPVQIALFHQDSPTTGTLLASATFVAPVAGAWNVASFAPVVTIVPGQTYVIAIWTTDHYVATVGLLTTPIVNAPLTATDGLFKTSAVMAFPDSGTGTSCYFADVVFNVGAPTTHSTMVGELNRLAGVTDRTKFLDAGGAGNLWAGTTGRSLVAALNIKAGNATPDVWKDLGGVVNQLAGTSGLGVAEALSRVA